MSNIMTGNELRQSFLEFFAERGHAVIPSAPLVPENDPTVLFTTAGMHPLVPYLLGEPHPMGRQLTDIQKCLRTVDIEEVGDSSHLTFFEMLGFWSLGDYWKQQSLRWTLQWFVHMLGLNQERISVTVFAGDEDAPRDDEAAHASGGGLEDGPGQGEIAVGRPRAGERDVEPDGRGAGAGDAAEHARQVIAGQRLAAVERVKSRVVDGDDDETRRLARALQIDEEVEGAGLQRLQVAHGRGAGDDTCGHESNGPQLQQPLFYLKVKRRRLQFGGRAPSRKRPSEA